MENCVAFSASAFPVTFMSGEEFCSTISEREQSVMSGCSLPDYSMSHVVIGDDYFYHPLCC